MKNPWKKLSEKEIYSNPWIRVEEHQVINPKGGKGIYGKVHFKGRALAVIPIDKHGHTWLVGQYRYTLDEYSWEVPMGGVPLEEDVLDGAKRELKEETGLTAADWKRIARIHTSNSVTDEEGFIYVAKGLTEGETEFDETEDLAIKRLPIEEAIEMVMSGEITDSLSMAGLLKVKVLMDQGLI
ncbi:NUDIX domain-containing protein [Reichenbachiella ulvae]|uniref:GDP-mannose pyrophosphatase n=1 Tax=Reichenbachiella ulvae TaxID=2980104 RepID=A0ABT3CQC6_9BACT|nr:NUDIX hydrolase [Reichenbachiella ulvae]MCV9385714.1 NUDIX hydrolase [Reichenbachiella ulvae]